MKKQLRKKIIDLFSEQPSRKSTLQAERKTQACSRTLKTLHFSSLSGAVLGFKLRPS
jgi:hypothetical protein